MTDTEQVGGTHYASKSIQPWAAMKAWMTPEQFKGFLRGNAIKYLARCDDKGGVEDLKKARHYLDKLIEFSGEEQEEAEASEQRPMPRELEQPAGTLYRYKAYIPSPLFGRFWPLNKFSGEVSLPDIQWVSITPAVSVAKYTLRSLVASEVARIHGLNKEFRNKLVVTKVAAV